MVLFFFLGLCFGGLGSYLTLGRLQKQEIAKAKQSFSLEQRKQEEHIQYLQEQFQLQEEDHGKLLRQLKKEKELSLSFQKKLRENSQNIDEILESLEESQQELLQTKDEEINILKKDIHELLLELEEKQAEIIKLKQEYNLSLQENLDKNNVVSESSIDKEQIEELITTLFPDLILLRDSIDIIATQPENLVKLLKSLKDITDGQPYSPIKVRATDKKWSECRVPHVSMMRIYFQKCKKSSGYQILISPKKNQKTQDKDYEWLKSQTNC